MKLLMSSLDQMNRKCGCVLSDGIYHHAIYVCSSTSQHNVVVQHAIVTEIIFQQGCITPEEVVGDGYIYIRPLQIDFLFPVGRPHPFYDRA